MGSRSSSVPRGRSADESSVTWPSLPPTYETVGLGPLPVAYRCIMTAKKHLADAVSRASAPAFADSATDSGSLLGIDLDSARIFTPWRIGPFQLQHRVVHPAMGRSRSAYGAESPSAAEYFAQRTTPGSLIISQATGVSADSVAWPWAASLHNNDQQHALKIVIDAVHERGGYWFQQLFHIGRCQTPALVKLARERAGLYHPDQHGYRPVSSSNVAESALNTHSGESPGLPHALTIEEIRRVQLDFKRAAERAIDAGADGIEILAGNGWLIDQFLHDNINKRTDEYGGGIENRSRFALEIIDRIAEIIGYQRIGIRVSPFSFFHETDGSQPLEQILHLCQELIQKGIGYLHVGQGKFSRNLSLEENITRLKSKGIAAEDISLRPFRRLLSSVSSLNSSHTPTALIGNGGYDPVSAILQTEEGLADGVSFGRRFISNPDLVHRLRSGFPLTPNDSTTFYTHGIEGYITYPNYQSKAGDIVPDAHMSQVRSVDFSAQSSESEQPRKKVAIIGAGVSGIASTAALSRLGGFEIQIFERRDVSGGFWLCDPIPTLDFESTTKGPKTVDVAALIPDGPFPVTIPRMQHPKLKAEAADVSFHVHEAQEILRDGSIFQESSIPDGRRLLLNRQDILAAVLETIQEIDKAIHFGTTVEDVQRLEGKGVRLTLRTENQDNTDTWNVQDFDHVLVATGHDSVPYVPKISGLEQWRRELHHSSTWHSPKITTGKKILLVSTDTDAVHECLRSFASTDLTISISQQTASRLSPELGARPYVVVVPAIAQVTSDTVYLIDGTRLTDIDAIVLATGYSYSFPFLSRIRPSPVEGCLVPGLYQHIFDIHDPETIAFNGIPKGAVPWLTWEKTAFLIALFWSGRIQLPSKEVQEAWEAGRLSQTGLEHFHSLDSITDQVIYFDELNELGAEYLFSHAKDDKLLRSYPFKWVLERLRSREQSL